MTLEPWVSNYKFPSLKLGGDQLKADISVADGESR
jgi:hypothetical protein